MPRHVRWQTETGSMDRQRTGRDPSDGRVGERHARRSTFIVVGTVVYGRLDANVCLYEILSSDD